jgi:hypothetical protein
MVTTQVKPPVELVESGSTNVPLDDSLLLEVSSEDVMLGYVAQKTDTDFVRRSICK